MEPRTTAEVISRYLRRMPNAQEANAFDSKYHAQIAQLGRLLTVADMVMEDEGVPEQVRLRVIRTIVYGAPDEHAAELRQIDLKARAAAMETTPLRWPVR